MQAFGSSHDLWTYPEYDPEIRATLLFRSPFAHPSVMMRRQVLLDEHLFFDESFATAQDYELWSRLPINVVCANIPEVLVLYRRHRTQITAAHPGAKADNPGRVRRALLSQLGIQPSPAEFLLHQKLSSHSFDPTPGFLMATRVWLEKLSEANKIGRFPEPEFTTLLARRWWSACRAAAKLGLWTLRCFLGSPLASRGDITATQKARLAAACLTHRV